MDKTTLLIDECEGMTKLDKANSLADLTILDLDLIGPLQRFSFPRIHFKVLRQMANMILAF